MSETEETQTQETHTGAAAGVVQVSEEQEVQDRTPRRRLQLASAETEEAALGAQLRIQMEDDIDSNRNDNFLSENVGELERDGNAHLRAEEERPSTEVGHSVPRITQRMARRPTSDCQSGRRATRRRTGSLYAIHGS